MVSNFLRELGAPFAVLLTLLAAGLAYLFSYLPEGSLAAVAASMVAFTHFSRGDRAMLNILTRGRERLVLLTDYGLIILPFFMEAVLLGRLKDAAGCALAPLLLVWLPSAHVDFRLPTHPLLLKGSVFYLGSLRVLLLPYVLLVVVAAVGICYNNMNLALVSTLLFVFLLGNFLFQELHRPHLFFYPGFRRMVLLNAKYSFLNAVVLLLPFGVVFFMASLTVGSALDVVVGWLACSLFLLQAYLLRFTAASLSVLQWLVLWFLFLVGCGALLWHGVLAVQLFIIVVLLLQAKTSTQSIFN